MLRNSLLGLNPEAGKAWLAELGRRADVELTRRPEELSIEEFVRLSDEFSCQRSKVLILCFLKTWLALQVFLILMKTMSS